MFDFVIKKLKKETKGHLVCFYELCHRKELLILKILKFEIYLIFLFLTRILRHIPDVLFVSLGNV
jgi:hypothetical protein